MGGRIIGGSGVRRAVKLGGNRTNWLECVSSSSCYFLRDNRTNFSKTMPALHQPVSAFGVIVTREIRGLRSLGRVPVRLGESHIPVITARIRRVTADFGGLRSVPAMVWESSLDVRSALTSLQDFLEVLEWINEVFD